MEETYFCRIISGSPFTRDNCIYETSQNSKEALTFICLPVR